VALEPVTSPARIFTFVLTVGISLLLLIPIGAAAQIVLTSQIEDETPTRVIVVMDPTGAWSNQKAAKNERLERASELYKSGVAPVIMVTGPQRAFERSQAELEKLGVPTNDVIYQPTGADTLGNTRRRRNAAQRLGLEFGHDRDRSGSLGAGAGHRGQVRN